MAGDRPPRDRAGHAQPLEPDGDRRPADGATAHAHGPAPARSSRSPAPGTSWSRSDPGRARPRCRSSSSRAPPRRPRSSPEGSGDLPDIETFTLATGEQLQVYLDPGAAGTNEFHVTAFDAAGRRAAALGPRRGGGRPRRARARRSTRRASRPGHFAAPVEVDAGRWRFEVVATTEGGTVLQAIQDQEIGA